MEKDNSVSIDHKNLQTLAFKMFKAHAKASPDVIRNVFLVKEQGNYNLWNQTDFVIPQVKSVNYGLERIWVLGIKILETFQMIWKIKNRFIVVKQPLRDGNLSHILAIFSELIYRTYSICRGRGKTNWGESFT